LALLLLVGDLAWRYMLIRLGHKPTVYAGANTRGSGRVCPKVLKTSSDAAQQVPDAPDTILRNPVIRFVWRLVRGRCNI
jgi:hypothetical protein